MSQKKIIGKRAKAYDRVKKLVRIEEFMDKYNSRMTAIGKIKLTRLHERIKTEYQ